MKREKAKDLQQIRYHISYDESLTFKDMEEMLHLIRISNNDVLQEMGVPRHRANDLQRIERIEPGSIEIILEKIMEMIENISDISTAVSAINFAYKSAKLILGKIKERHERPIRNPKEDRKFYDKYEVTVEVEERSAQTNNNTTVYVIHIHICNRNSRSL